MSKELRALELPFAEVLRDIARQWIARGKTLESPRGASGEGSDSSPIVQAIEVTSSTADADGYPARIQLYDGTNWTNTYAEVRAVQIGSTIAGAVLATGFYPPGRLMRVADSGMHVYGVHPGAAASGGTELKGLTFTSDTGSTADSDPGNGLFKWNNATQASATELYFDNQTADAISLTTFYASIAGVGLGFIYLQQADDSTKWQLWKWSTVTDGTGYRKFTVAHQASGGSIADAKTVLCDFAGGPDASATVRGWMNTTTQTFNGLKTFDDGIVIGPGAGTETLEVSADFLTFLNSAQPTAQVSIEGSAGATVSSLNIVALTDDNNKNVTLTLQVEETPLKRLHLGATDTGTQVTYSIDEDGVGTKNGATGTFTTADTPALTVKVVGGVIVDIS